MSILVLRIPIVLLGVSCAWALPARGDCVDRELPLAEPEVVHRSQVRAAEVVAIPSPGHALLEWDWPWSSKKGPERVKPGTPRAEAERPAPRKEPRASASAASEPRADPYRFDGAESNGWIWPLALLIGFMTLIGACCCTVMFNNTKEQRLREIDMQQEWLEEQKDIKAFNYALKVNARIAEQQLIEQAEQEQALAEHQQHAALEQAAFAQQAAYEQQTYQPLPGQGYEQQAYQQQLAYDQQYQQQGHGLGFQPPSYAPHAPSGLRAPESVLPDVTPSARDPYARY